MTKLQLSVKKSIFAKKNFASVRDFLSIEHRRRLVVSLIIPLFTYGDVVFSSLNETQKRKLELCFNSCLRFIHKRRKFDHLADVRDSILGCNLETYFKYRLMVFLFTIMIHKEPYYLFNSLEFLNSARSRNLRYPRPRSTFMNHSFIVRAAQQWNSLPNGIKMSTSINEFKIFLKSHLNFANLT